MLSLVFPLQGCITTMVGEAIQHIISKVYYIIIPLANLSNIVLLVYDMIMLECALLYDRSFKL